MSRAKGWMFENHFWADCHMCGRMVICGKCGNNSCNSGYGTINGVECDECPNAYEMQNKGEANVRADHPVLE